jgi:hypothetical protein
MDSFYNELDEEGVSDEQYDRAQAIWTTFNCRKFEDYHDLYLKTDVILLGDAFENFRDVSMSTYGLDPAHYLTTPSLTWDACLKFNEHRTPVTYRPRNVRVRRKRNARWYFRDQ